MSQFVVFLYSNGRKFEGPQGLTFEGDTRPIQIKRDISYQMLKRKIHAKLNLQSHQIISSLTYKFLIPRNKSKYTALEIFDDEYVECMINTFDQHTMTVLELYVDIDVVSSSSLHVHHVDENTVAPCCGQSDAYIGLSDDDEDWNRDLTMVSSEDEDEGEIPDGDSFDTEVEGDFDVVGLASPVVMASPIASSLSISELPQQTACDPHPRIMDLAEELSGKMVDVNVKLKRLEELVALSISNEGEEERPYQLLDELEGWKLSKKDLETDLYKYSLQRLLLPISWCEKVLGFHERYVSKNFEIRYENLLKKLEEPGELPEYIPEYAVNEIIAEKLIATTKAFLGEFKQELQNESQNTRRKTLVQSLQEQHEQSIEWNNLNEKLIYVGIQISKVLVKFLVSMAGSDLKIQDLKTKIESLAYVYNKEQKSIVIDKFLNVVDITSNIMSMSEKKLKAELAFGAFEEEELEKIIFDSIMDLDFIWNGLSMTVPESSDMLAGALLRAQNMIGQILYNIHGVKVRIPEEKDERWKTFKVIIGQLWKGEQGQER